MPSSSTFTAINTSIVSGSTTSSIVFANIPSTYTDLFIVAETYNTSSNFLQYMTMGTSNGNYSGTVMRGDGASAVSSRYINDNTMLADSPVGMNYQNSAFGVYTYYIPNYSNTTTGKVVLSRFGGDRSGAGSVIQSAHTKRGSTTAIDTITFSVGGGYFAANSTFTLYGIGAA